MKRSSMLALLLAAVVGAGAFAQEQKHRPFDVLLGFNLGSGISPGFGELLFSSISDQTIPKGAYAVTFDAGVTADFYLFNWLSFTSGLLLHPDIYLTLDQELTGVKKFTDIAATPLCLTIPLAAHVNVPKVEWLYLGLGLNLNLPLVSMLDAAVDTVSETTGVNLDIDTKGKFFVGLPIDVGCDFVEPGGGGTRLFLRVTPEFHEKGTAIPIGIVWQVWNWKLFGKK